jgi:hypothetical protein
MQKGDSCNFELMLGEYVRYCRIKRKEMFAEVEPCRLSSYLAV